MIEELPEKGNKLSSPPVVMTSIKQLRLVILKYKMPLIPALIQCPPITYLFWNFVVVVVVVSYLTNEQIGVEIRMERYE